MTLVTSAGGEPVAAHGTLRLAPNEPALRTLAGAGDTTGSSVSAPLYGWAKIDLAAVGALELGSVGSQDPQRPGVLVLEQRPHAAAAPPTITLRLGSLANRRGAQPQFDGGYTALYVHRVENTTSFFGTWASGVHTFRVEGHFCATLDEESKQHES